MSIILLAYTVIMMGAAIYVGYKKIVINWWYVDILYYQIAAVGVLFLSLSFWSQFEAHNVMLKIESTNKKLEYIETNSDVISREEFGEKLVNFDRIDIMESKMLVWSERERFGWIIINLPDPTFSFETCLEKYWDEGCKLIFFYGDYLRRAFDVSFSPSLGWSYREPKSLHELCEFRRSVDDVMDNVAQERCSGLPAWAACPIRITMWDLEKRCDPEERAANPELMPKPTVDDAYRIYLDRVADRLVEDRTGNETAEEAVARLRQERAELEHRLQQLSYPTGAVLEREYMSSAFRYLLWPFVIVLALSLKVGKAAGELRNNHESQVLRLYRFLRRR